MSYIGNKTTILYTSIKTLTIQKQFGGSYPHQLVKAYLTSEFGCNCRTRENCLLQNQCLASNLTYQAQVENNANKGTKIYFGLAETSFEVQFANHNQDFNHEQYKISGELSEYI